MLTDQLIRNLSDITDRLSSQKQPQRIFKVPPQVESAYHKLSNEVTNWFDHVGKFPMPNKN